MHQRAACKAFAREEIPGQGQRVVGDPSDADDQRRNRDRRHRRHGRSAAADARRGHGQARRQRLAAPTRARRSSASASATRRSSSSLTTTSATCCSSRVRSASCSSWRHACRATRPPTIRTTRPSVGEIRDLGATRVVFGPGTFLNQAAERSADVLRQQIGATYAGAQQAAAAAAKQAKKKGLTPIQQQAAATAAQQAVVKGALAKYGGLASQMSSIGFPAVTNKLFVEAIVFDSRLPAGTPKSKFGYLFPSSDGALVSIRLAAGPRRSDAAQGDLADPRGDRRPRLQARRRQLRAQRRARGRPGPCRRARRRDRPAARRRADRHGTHPDGLLRAAAAAAAAVRRARRLGDGLRPTLDHRRHADDGLGSRPAGRHRAGRRLRDSAAGALPRGGDVGPAAGGLGGHRRRSRRPRHRDRGAGDDGRLPVATALADTDGPRVRLRARRRHHLGAGDLAHRRTRGPLQRRPRARSPARGGGPPARRTDREERRQGAGLVFDRGPPGA